MVDITSLSNRITLEPLPTEAEAVADERRMPVQLFYYWNRLRGDRAFPVEDAINAEDITHIWDYCFLIQVNDLKNRRKADFTYLGSEIIALYHDLLSEEDACDIISPHTSHLSQNFWMVIDRKKPIMQSGEFLTGRGNTIKFRQCLLPLGKSDDEVEAIFGCARLRLYA